MRFAAIGLDHHHIYDLTEGLLDAGASCAGYWPQTTDPRVLEGVAKRFPDVPAIGDRAALSFAAAHVGADDAREMCPQRSRRRPRRISAMGQHRS